MPLPSIAVVGASANRAKFGNKCVRAYAQAGYEVIPINPRESHIEGHKVWPSLRSAPIDHFDRISVYLPPEACLAALPDLASKPAGEVWFNPGADDPDVLAQARAMGINVVTGCSIVDIGISPNDL